MKESETSQRHHGIQPRRDRQTRICTTVDVQDCEDERTGKRRDEILNAVRLWFVNNGKVRLKGKVGPTCGCEAGREEGGCGMYAIFAPFAARFNVGCAAPV
jgi:hypothetical protein